MIFPCVMLIRCLVKVGALIPVITSIHSSIFCNAYPYKGRRCWSRSQLALGREVVYTLDQSPVHDTKRQTSIHTHHGQFRVLVITYFTKLCTNITDEGVIRGFLYPLISIMNKVRHICFRLWPLCTQITVFNLKMGLSDVWQDWERPGSDLAFKNISITTWWNDKSVRKGGTMKWMQRAVTETNGISCPICFLSHCWGSPGKISVTKPREMCGLEKSMKQAQFVHLTVSWEEV